MNRISLSGSEDGNIRPRKFASKNPAVSALQDLLFYQLTGIGFYAKNLLMFDKTDKNLNENISRFIYLSNKGINFGINTMINAINEANKLKVKMANLYRFLCSENGIKPQKAPFVGSVSPGETLSQMVSQANIINAQKSIKAANLNLYAMKEIIRLSLCSSANYLEHIKNSFSVPSAVYSDIYYLLNFLAKNNVTTKECTSFAMKAGELQMQVLELVLKEYEKKYGFTEKRSVSSNNLNSNSILVAGEDFVFLKKLLEETEGKEINIYTYGALNYAHAFPKMNQYKNLKGIYTGKYCDFASNIEAFPGIVVITSGNFEELTDIYRGRIFATEDISMLGVTKIDKDNLQVLINFACEAQCSFDNYQNEIFNIGFGSKELKRSINRLYNAFLDKTILGIFVFLGCSNCDGDMNYLKKIMKNLPDNIAFITLDCLFSEEKINKSSKNKRINLGQYLNLYTLVRLLFGLAGKLGKKIQEMPVDITLKLKDPHTVAALLMLLSMGIKDIKIDSDLPNYLTSALIKFFGKNFGLAEVKDAKTDIKSLIQKRA